MECNLSRRHKHAIYPTTEELVITLFNFLPLLKDIFKDKRFWTYSYIRITIENKLKGKSIKKIGKKDKTMGFNTTNRK